ncbi:MAG: hypothetical protein ACK55Z_17405 [bacterium]
MDEWHFPGLKSEDFARSLQFEEDHILEDSLLMQDKLIDIKLGLLKVEHQIE